MRLSVPASILLGSVIVALGLFFGLRRPEPVSPAPAPAPPVASQGSAVAGGNSLRPSQPAATTTPTKAPATATPAGPLPPSADQTLAAVTAEVEGAKPRWKAACWDTADPAKRKPGKYTAGLAFDAAGRLTVSGVGEIRGESDPEVAQCMRLQVNDFKIPAPGRYVVFDIPFTMP